MTTHHYFRQRLRRGYTLIELLAAASIIAIGTTAAVSLSASIMLQEELAFRVAVTRNYQENMVRLWQLGLSATQAASLMPDQSQNPILQTAIQGNPALIDTGVVTLSGTSVESATCTAVINVSQTPPTEIAGASLTITAFRPRLTTTLRTAPP